MHLLLDYCHNLFSIFYLKIYPMIIHILIKILFNLPFLFRKYLYIKITFIQIPFIYDLITFCFHFLLIYLFMDLNSILLIKYYFFNLLFWQNLKIMNFHLNQMKNYFSLNFNFFYFYSSNLIFFEIII
jgi:hypothetical protein